MRKVLPLASPKIRCYANHAHIFSILGAYSEKYIPWVYNYYVQLYVPYDLREFKADYMIPGLYYHTPNLLVSRIDRRTALSAKEGVIEAIKHYIDNEYYVYVLLEVNKIAAYNNTHFQKHDPLIYGYDDKKEEIYFADTFIHGKYGNGIASYDEIIMAVGNEIQWNEWGVADRLLDVLCMKYRENPNSFVFTKEMYITLLEDYMEQRNSYNNHWKVRGIGSINKIENVCGIGVYSYLQDYVNGRIEKSRKLDRRGFYVIWEHKVIWEETLNYLLGRQWKERCSDEACLLENDIAAALNMLNLCLKYNVTKDEKLIDKIKQYALAMEEWEKVLIPRIIRIVNNN